MYQQLHDILAAYACGAQIEDANVLNRLAAQEDPVPRWRFGISEYSLSFGREGPPRVRAMAEVLSRTPAQDGDDEALRLLGQRLFRHLHRRYGTECDEAAFNDVMLIAYGAETRGSRAAHLRFGIGLEWAPGRAASAKFYADLFAGDPGTALVRLRAIFDRLGLGAHLPTLTALLADGDTVPACRIVGIDLSPGGLHYVRLYLSGAQYTRARLHRLLRRFDAHELIWQLDLFDAHVRGGLVQQNSDRTMLLGLVFTKGTTGAPVVKLDGYLPAHHCDDRASCRAVTGLAASLGIELTGFAKTAASMAPRGNLGGTQNILQYCSLDLRPSPKLNLYLRPLYAVAVCENMPVALRPRRKPAQVVEPQHAV